MPSDFGLDQSKMTFVISLNFYADLINTKFEMAYLRLGFDICTEIQVKMVKTD